MKNNKTAQREQAQKEPVQAGDSGIGLAVGLSLGVLFGIVMDDIRTWHDDGCCCGPLRRPSRCYAEEEQRIRGARE